MGGEARSVRVVNLAGEPLQKVLVERIYELNTVDSCKSRTALQKTRPIQHGP